MLLAVDVGNTEITIGVFEGQELAQHWRAATVAERTADEHALLLGGFLAYQGRVSLAGMVAVAAVAAVAGYLLGYETGRRLGPALRTSALGRRIGPARWDRVEAMWAGTLNGEDLYA